MSFFSESRNTVSLGRPDGLGFRAFGSGFGGVRVRVQDLGKPLLGHLWVAKNPINLFVIVLMMQLYAP